MVWYSPAIASRPLGPLGRGSCAMSCSTGSSSPGAAGSVHLFDKAQRDLAYKPGEPPTQGMLA